VQPVLSRGATVRYGRTVAEGSPVEGGSDLTDHFVNAATRSCRDIAEVDRHGPTDGHHRQSVSADDDQVIKGPVVALRLLSQLAWGLGWAPSRSVTTCTDPYSSGGTQELPLAAQGA
jgi:hypothetical protein